MADATRYRTLEDQLKKQEAAQVKIQELLEGMLRAQQALDAKLEVNEKKTEDKMSSLEAQMMAFMKRVSGKGEMERTVPIIEKTPLLPTPGQKAHEDVDSSLWLERPTKNQWTLRPSLFNYRFSAVDHPGNGSGNATSTSLFTRFQISNG